MGHNINNIFSIQTGLLRPPKLGLNIIHVCDILCAKGNQLSLIRIKANFNNRLCPFNLDEYILSNNNIWM